jgi:hypothetical protein
VQILFVLEHFGFFDTAISLKRRSKEASKANGRRVDAGNQKKAMVVAKKASW